MRDGDLKDWIMYHQTGGPPAGIPMDQLMRCVNTLVHEGVLHKRMPQYRNAVDPFWYRKKTEFKDFEFAT